MVESLAQLLLLLLALALFLNFVQHGWPGVTRWLRVKFIGGH